MTPHRLLPLVVALACLTACAHTPTLPRLVLAGRFTARAEGAREGVLLASLALPIERAVDPPTLAPEAVVLPAGDEVPSLDAPYRDDPPLEALIERVLASPLHDPTRAREARDRARLSGLLPVLRADVRRGSGWDLRTQQGVTADTAILASDDSWSVVGSATLRLDRLLFAREEPALLVEERRLEEARLRLVAEVVRLFTERRRLQLERDRRGVTDLPTEARIAELGAMLDVLCDGGMRQRGR